jgi:hypothetical protein
MKVEQSSLCGCKVVFAKTDIGHNTCTDGLTLYKTYHVEDQETFWSFELSCPVTLYLIETDKGTFSKKNSKIFISLEEHRNNQLDKLLY